MKNINKKFAILLVFLCCIACNSNNADDIEDIKTSEGPLLKSCITWYLLNVEEIVPHTDKEYSFIFGLRGKSLGMEHTHLYNPYAVMFGDTSYNVHALFAPPRTALVDTILTITIKSKENFNERHPAGSSLDDIIELSYLSYKGLIDDQYTRKDSDYFVNIQLQKYNLSSGIILLEPALKFKLREEPAEKGDYPLSLELEIKNKEIHKKDFIYEYR